MSEPTPTVLRETKMGQRGFVKEDVITYLDELNSKIVALEEERNALKENGSSDPQELTKYKNQVENLQEKLNTSNNALRAAKKENEELQKTIAQLKAANGAANGQANAAATAALEAAKKEIETLKEQLKGAEAKIAASGNNAQANAQTTAALEAAKKEIEDLRGKLKASEAKAASAGAAGGANEAEVTSSPTRWASQRRSAQGCCLWTTDRSWRRELPRRCLSRRGIRACANFFQRYFKRKNDRKNAVPDFLSGTAFLRFFCKSTRNVFCCFYSRFFTVFTVLRQRRRGYIFQNKGHIHA